MYYCLYIGLVIEMYWNCDGAYVLLLVHNTAPPLFFHFFLFLIRYRRHIWYSRQYAMSIVEPVTKDGISSLCNLSAPPSEGFTPVYVLVKCSSKLILKLNNA